MKKRLIFWLLFIASFAIGVYPLWSEKVIASATLTITLRVPERPVTPETEEGLYDGYKVEKTADTVFVTAV